MRVPIIEMKEEKKFTRDGVTIRRDVWTVKNTSSYKFLIRLLDYYGLEKNSPYRMESPEVDARGKIEKAIRELKELREADIIWDNTFIISYELKNKPFISAYKGIIVE